MELLVAILLLVCIGMPLGFAWRMWRLDEPSRAAWAVVAADSAVFVALVLIVGRWDIAGTYTRFALLALFLAAILRSWRRHAGRPWRPAGSRPVWRSHWTTLVSLAGFGGVLAYVCSGLVAPPGARELGFPLKGGRFMVGQGGGVGLLNHHADHPEQRYAADIAAIDAIGLRATGLLPAELDRYVIYGADVISPCEGSVAAARDGLPDLAPPQADPENAAGNHVVIDCGGVHVMLAHLQRGSLEVRVGNRLAAGDAVGKVGNSGNTTEPHLHIHAFDPATRSGVPMSFGGRLPVRNSLFRR
jgi:hypothetical protein